MAATCSKVLRGVFPPAGGGGGGDCLSGVGA